MSWRDSLATAQSRLAALEVAELQVLTGKQVRLVMYDGEKLEFQQAATAADLQRAIYETRRVIAGFSAHRRTGGAIIPIFRG